METTKKYYLEKYKTHRKNTFSQWSFLKHFTIPERPITFILMVALSGASLQVMFGYLWLLPSALAVFLMWNVIVVLMKQEDIAEECVIKEIVFQEGLTSGDCSFGPMYVTDEDREIILEDCIHKYWKLSLWQELKMYWVDLFLTSILYALVCGTVYLFNFIQ